MQRFVEKYLYLKNPADIAEKAEKAELVSKCFIHLYQGDIFWNDDYKKWIMLQFV